MTKRTQMAGGGYPAMISIFGDVTNSGGLPEWDFVEEIVDGVKNVYSPDKKILLFSKSLEEIERMRQEAAAAEAEAASISDEEWYGAFKVGPDNPNIEIGPTVIATGENNIFKKRS